MWVHGSPYYMSLATDVRTRVVSHKRPFPGSITQAPMVGMMRPGSIGTLVQGNRWGDSFSEVRTFLCVLWWFGVRFDSMFGQQNEASDGSNRVKSLAPALFIKIRVLSFQNIRPCRFWLAKRSRLFIFVFHQTHRIGYKEVQN